MRNVLIRRAGPLLAVALTVAFLPSSGLAAVAGGPAGGSPVHARITRPSDPWHGGQRAGCDDRAAVQETADQGADRGAGQDAEEL